MFRVEHLTNKNQDQYKILINTKNKHFKKVLKIRIEDEQLYSNYLLDSYFKYRKQYIFA